MCLSGTSEMALAGYFSNKVFPADKLPMKVAAVSRCFRAEASSIAEERGIFRYNIDFNISLFLIIFNYYLKSSSIYQSGNVCTG